MAEPDRTASLMTPSKLAQIQPKSAVSPAAWLSQMAADAGHQHVRRLRELREEVEAQALQRDDSALASELGRLAEALPRLDFGLLRDRGWWARATGKSRSAGALFAAQFSQIEALLAPLAAQAQAMEKKQHDEATACDLTLLEVEVEYHAVDKIIDQGARWLHDMRNQLKVQQGTTDDPAAAQRTKDDEARCEILVARLKTLRAVRSAAQRAHGEGANAAARRASLVKMLRQSLAPGLKDWQGRLSTLAAAATDAGARELSVDGPMEAHRDLQLCLKQVIADGEQLHAQEAALAQSVAALGTELAAA